MDKILRLPDIVARTKLGKTTIYRMAKEGNFPKPVKLGKHASGWFQHEIEKWMSELSNRRYDSKEIQGGSDNA